MFLKFLFCLIGLFAVTNADDTCTFTDRYVHYPELKISYKFNVRPLKWAKAREYCRSENADLASPKNAAERDTIKKIFAEYPAEKLINPTYNNHIFLGFHDMFDENEFIVGSSDSIDYFYRDLETGQPSGGKLENCMSMERNGKYHDYPHDGTAAFICQKKDWDYEDNIRRDFLITRDPGYLRDPVSNKRFKLHTDLKTWAMARAICYAEGGNLAVIENRQDEMFLTDMLNNPKNDVKYSSLVGNAWVGFHDMFIEGQFESVRGKTMEKIGYAKWIPGQPDGGISQNCVSVSATGQIQDAPCSFMLVYFCEIRPKIEIIY